jgi:hypothetical protein
MNGHDTLALAGFGVKILGTHHEFWERTMMIAHVAANRPAAVRNMYRRRSDYVSQRTDGLHHRGHDLRAGRVGRSVSNMAKRRSLSMNCRSC